MRAVLLHRVLLYQQCGFIKRVLGLFFMKEKRVGEGGGYMPLLRGF